MSYINFSFPAYPPAFHISSHSMHWNEPLLLSVQFRSYTTLSKLTHTAASPKYLHSLLISICFTSSGHKYTYIYIRMVNYETGFRAESYSARSQPLRLTMGYGLWQAWRLGQTYNLALASLPRQSCMKGLNFSPVLSWLLPLSYFSRAWTELIDTLPELLLL